MKAFCIVLAILAIFLPSTAAAHGMRSVFVEIQEITPGNAAIHVRSSIPDPELVITASDCSLIFDTDRSTDLDRTGVLDCADGATRGHAIGIRGLGPISSEAVVWVQYGDGTTFSRILAREDSTWTLPANSSAWSVARQYVELGIRHIATGWDHLLFLLLLVLTLRSPRAVLFAETAFTLSHSLSFTATALGWIRISPLAAEACIALSLVLVALDVGRTAAKRWSSAGLAFLFGLVHGLGFAGGLREIGLPERDVAAALVSFGLGVELGQVAFLVVVLLLVHLASRWRAWPKAALSIGYASGGLASYWLIERALACFLRT